MKLIEQKYHVTRGECADTYQWLEVVQEAENNREYVRFELMQERWRSPQEAASYLQWAASQILTLTRKSK